MYNEHELAEKIRELDDKINKQEKTLKKMIKVLKGKSMTDTDFDFDSLLADIDNVEVIKDEPKEVPSEIQEVQEQEVQEQEVQEQEIQEQEVQEQEVQEEPIINTVTPDVSTKNMITDSEIIDYQKETESYLRDMIALKEQEEALKAQKQDIVNDWKERGVNVKIARKASSHIRMLNSLDPHDAEEFEKMVDLMQSGQMPVIP